jgi:anti-sigma-K factor RskA
MHNKKIDDEMISTLVRSVQYKVPDSVEEQVNASIAKTKARKTWLFKRPLFWYPVSAAAVMVIIAALVIFQPFVNKRTIDPGASITEIKTEFELKDKNIKILWVQKKDFKLRLID